jgi:hypothetical protein
MVLILRFSNRLKWADDGKKSLNLRGTGTKFRYVPIKAGEETDFIIKKLTS